MPMTSRFSWLLRRVAEEKELSLLFAASVALFSYQLSKGIGWDFAAYILNAKYLFAGGYYFELLRPPLIPAILGIFGLLFGFAMAPYIYIILSSLLHLVSSMRLANALGIDKRIFYAFSVTPFFVIYGMQQGTELLSLALLQLFAAEAISGRNSGVFLGLSMLARYTNAAFAPLLLFGKSAKTIAKSVAIAALTFVPWLAYNYAATGNPLTSFADFYALNVLSRTGSAAPVELIDIAYVLGFLAPLFLAGAIMYLRKWQIKDKKLLFVLAFVALASVAYIGSPHKNPRFLFALIFPVAYFSERAISSVSHAYRRIMVVSLVLLGLAVSAYAITVQNPVMDVSDALSSIDKKCSYMSNYWVYLDYYGTNSMPAPRESGAMGYFISRGEKMIFFSGVGDPLYGEDRKFLRQFGVIEEKPEYIVVGDKNACAPPEQINMTFMEWADFNSRAAGGPAYVTDPYAIFLERKITR